MESLQLLLSYFLLMGKSIPLWLEVLEVFTLGYEKCTDNIRFILHMHD